MMNAGQICLAPDYMLVPDEQEQAVVDGLKAAVSTMYPTLLANPDYTSIVNDRHHQRLQDWLEDARAKGATIETVNPANEDFASANTRKMPLHIVRDATDDMTVMQEEIFGPILPVRRYDAGSSAIAEVNRRDRPLGLYYFGDDDAERRRVLDRTISGGVTLNDVIFHVIQEELPFGGIGPSGMGAYHGATASRRSATPRRCIASRRSTSRSSRGSCRRTARRRGRRSSGRSAAEVGPIQKPGLSVMSARWREALDARAQQRQDGVAGGGEAVPDGQAGAVALMDALGDHRQFKKSEGDVKIELAERAAGLP